jgi:hypothetical protein
MLTLLIGTLVPLGASALEPSDTEQIKRVIEAYYDGMTRGDAEVLGAVFHDKWRLATLTGSGDDALLVGGKREYIELYDGKKQPEYPKDRRISSIDIANNSLAVVRIDSRTRDHTVFFTLFKISGTWSMISKVPRAELRAFRRPTERASVAGPPWP